MCSLTCIATSGTVRAIIYSLNTERKKNETSFPFLPCVLKRLFGPPLLLIMNSNIHFYALILYNAWFSLECGCKSALSCLEMSHRACALRGGARFSASIMTWHMTCMCYLVMHTDILVGAAAWMHVTWKCGSVL